MMQTLTASNIFVHYGRRQILEAVDLEACAGEITVIAGPNGSGKSTLVRTISGEVQFKGAVSLNGHDLREMKNWQVASLRAVLPQETTVAFPFTVGEIVRFGLTAGEFGNISNSAQLVEDALERAGLVGFSTRYVQELSGGERQRVQLARVLCQIWEPVGPEGPRWLILDEPVSSLDVRHQLSIMDIARDYAIRGGGVIAVMHDLNLSAIYADKVVMMKDGVVASAGAPKAVLTADILSEVFDCPLQPNFSPSDDTFILPHSALAGRGHMAMAAE